MEREVKEERDGHRGDRADAEEMNRPRVHMPAPSRAPVAAVGQERAAKETSWRSFVRSAGRMSWRTASATGQARNIERRGQSETIYQNPHSTAPDEHMRGRPNGPDGDRRQDEYEATKFVYDYGDRAGGR